MLEAVSRSSINELVGYYPSVAGNPGPAALPCSAVCRSLNKVEVSKGISWPRVLCAAHHSGHPAHSLPHPLITASPPIQSLTSTPGKSLLPHQGSNKLSLLGQKQIMNKTKKKSNYIQTICTVRYHTASRYLNNGEIWASYVPV